MKKSCKIIALLLALIVAAVSLASCEGNEREPEKEEKTEEAINFEPVDKDTGEAETEDATPDTEKETEEVAEDTEEVTDSTEEETAPSGSSNIGLNALAFAQKLIGTKFRLGGIGPDEFDNSGFIYYIFKQSGVEVPRLARDMPSFGKAVARADIQPGDILVFSNDIGGGPEFEGIYVGDGQFIACFNPDKPTQQAPIGNYWEARFITARRAG